MEKRRYFSVSGVSDKMWRMAKASAAMKGMSLGEWLSLAILTYARECITTEVKSYEQEDWVDEEGRPYPIPNSQQ